MCEINVDAFMLHTKDPNIPMAASLMLVFSHPQNSLGACTSAVSGDCIHYARHERVEQQVR